MPRLLVAHAQTSQLTHNTRQNMSTPTLTRSHLCPQIAPPAPRGHYSHLSQAHSFGQLAILSTDPLQPRYVRRFHRHALEGSLAALATAVRSVATRRN